MQGKFMNITPESIENADSAGAVIIKECLIMMAGSIMAVGSL
jgi:hypothetical protein